MTTRTIRQVGGDFSSYATALADAATVANDIMSIEDFWTVDDTNAATVSDTGIETTTDNDSYHGGVYDESSLHYRLVVSGAHCLTVNNPGAVIDGLAIVQDGVGVSDEGIRVSPPSGTTTIRRSIIRATTTTVNQDGVNVNNNTLIVEFENTIIYGFSRAGLSVNITSGGPTHTININVLTVWDNNKGNEIGGGGINVRVTQVAGTANINIFRSLALGNNDTNANDYNDASTAGTRNWVISNCIDSDGSITVLDAGAVDPLEDRTPTDNPTPGVGDFVIFNDITTSPFNLLLVDNSIDNDAQDAGSALTGAGLTLPILDIANDIRVRLENQVDTGADSIPNPEDSILPEYGQRRAAIGDPSVYGATIVRS